MPDTYEYPETEFDEPPRKPMNFSMRGLLLALSAAIVLIDHLSKKYIVHHLPPGRAPLLNDLRAHWPGDYITNSFKLRHTIPPCCFWHMQRQFCCQIIHCDRRKKR